MLQRLYDWMMGLARHRHALPALAVISFLESSIFPIPPDIMLIPMVLADRRRAWWIALVCTVSSVIGGFAGYAVGYFLFETIGRAVIEFYRMADQFDAFQQAFLEYGWWIIVIKGATPIPYKLITISAGVAGFPLLAFAVASMISRGMRFFLVAGLLWWFGEPIRRFVERHLTLVTTVFAVLLIGGFVIVRYVF